MTLIPKNPFILVDGSSYLFRAYHALPPLTTAKGQPTGAIFGVVNMLRRLIKDYKPERMAVVFDSKEKNFRHELYTAYKANRSVMPDELQSQLVFLNELIQAFGLPLIRLPGIEADDIIGSLAREAKTQGWFTLISTGDKDFAQIVDDQTILINTMSQEVLDIPGVVQKFGVSPEKIIDYLTLIGDSVDNIPGVPKVGPKTAVKWLEEYGSLDAILEKAQEIPGKVGENLRSVINELPLFKQLVTIQSHLSLNIHPDDLFVKKEDVEKLRVLFTELEFKSWLKDLNASTIATTAATVTATAATTISESTTPASSSATATLPTNFKQGHYETLLTETSFNRWLSRLKESSLFAFHTETNGNETKADSENALVGLSFAIKPEEAVYIPLGHEYLGCPTQLSRTWVLSQLKSVLEDPKYQKIGHHLKQHAKCLAAYGIAVAGLQFDVTLESYVLLSTAAKHDIPTLALRYLGAEAIHYEDIAGKGAKQLPFYALALEEATRYAAESVDLLLRVHHILWPKIQAEPSLRSVFETIEMPLVSVLTRMELQGVLIDQNILKKHSETLAARLSELEQAVYQFAGSEFNLNSPKQLQEILFNQLKLPILEKTPTGQPSTSESVLQELAESYPLPKLILEYRSLSKLKSTYTDKLPELINPKTGRVHTSYHQTVTSTGRLSSTDPNLQNIPIRTQEGRKVRTAFIAPPGYKIMAVDYSQIELRIMAHMSQDENLIKAFEQGDDIHRATASKIFGIPLESVTGDQRRSAKAINFGLMYGMSSFGLSKQLGISTIDAESHMDHYFKSFPKVKGFMEKIRLQALEKGYVETLFGRRLYLPELHSKNHMVRKAAERAAINAPMQGTNADIVKLAMLQLDRWILETGCPLRMILQVHDELVFEVADDFLEPAQEKIREVMEHILELSVQLKIDFGVGNNWEEAHSL